MSHEIGNSFLPMNEYGVSISGSSDPSNVNDNDRVGYRWLIEYKSSIDMVYSAGIMDKAKWVLYDGIW